MIERIFIHTTCPHCGAPLEFPSGTWAMTCAYCSTPLRIIGRGRSLRFTLKDSLTGRTAVSAVERHARKEGLALPRFGAVARRRWVPYWLARGRFFAWMFGTLPEVGVARPGFEYALGVEQVMHPDEPTSVREAPVKGRRFISKEMNHSFAACEGDVDVSLGVRTQVMHLWPLDRKSLVDAGDEVASVSSDRDHAMKRAMKSAAMTLTQQGVRADAVVSRLVGEELVLVYLPQWLVSYESEGGEKTAVVDGVAQRVERVLHARYVPPLPAPDEQIAVEVLDVLPHRCPHCGWDMPVDPAAAVFPCTNCGRLWREEGDKLAQPPTVVAGDAERGDRLLPFWVFESRVKTMSGIVENQSQWVNLCPGALLIRGDPAAPFRIFVPAFRVVAGETAVKAGAAFTTMQTDFARGSENAGGGETCVLPESEAAELAIIVLCGSLEPLIRSGRFFEALSLRMKRPVLAWIPFHRDDIYLRDRLIGATIEARAIPDRES